MYIPQSQVTPNKWYHIQSRDLSLDQNILSYTHNSNNVIVALAPYFGLGKDDEQYWQFRVDDGYDASYNERYFI